MTREEAKSCIGTIELLQRLAYNIHGVMDVIDADNCKKIINALEKEPTTKNDLGVDAVSRKDVHDMLENLPVTVEHKWFNWLQMACNRLAELPSVTPQKPKSEWEHDHEILKAYSNGANEVLDRIRAEIDDATEIHSDGEFYIKNIDVKRIIDKYKAGSEENNV